MLEFLNGRSMLKEAEPWNQNNGTGSKNREKPVRLTQSFLKKNFDREGCTTMRTIWLQYVQEHHEDILKFVGEEASGEFNKQAS